METKIEKNCWLLSNEINRFKEFSIGERRKKIVQTKNKMWMRERGKWNVFAISFYSPSIQNWIIELHFLWVTIKMNTTNMLSWNRTHYILFFLCFVISRMITSPESFFFFIFLLLSCELQNAMSLDAKIK